MSFKIVNNVCRPLDSADLDNFKGIQREANRFLDEHNKTLLFVDGRIGNKTRDAVNFVLGSTFRDCAAIAEKAPQVLSQLRTLAASRQLAVVQDPESIVRSAISPPSTFDPETNTVVNPSFSTAGFGGVPFWLMALVGAGGYYYFYKKPKGKKKKSKSLMGGF
jgi:hypothetical protein